jgi:hypothetical protein
MTDVEEQNQNGGHSIQHAARHDGSFRLITAPTGVLPALAACRASSRMSIQCASCSVTVAISGSQLMP